MLTAQDRDDHRQMTQLGFDYGQLAPEVREEVQEHTRRLHELERRTGEGIIEMGQHLIAVKAQMPGEFREWTRAEFGWSDFTTTKFMQVAKVFGEGNVEILHFAPSALSALASGNVPESIRKDFIQIAEAGDKVTHADVREAITDYRERAERATLTVDAETGEVLDDEAPIEGMFSEIAPPATPPALWDTKPPGVSTAHVSHNSGENEWYTPAAYINAARQVMGAIDLDPASSAKANETVQASTIYTKDDNGLAQPWHGRVWMNPPYAQPLISHFAEKVADEYRAGNIDEAIVLVNNATETRWFQYMAAAAAAVSLPAGRVRFLDPDGNPGAPLQGQAILYFGDRPDSFREAFGGFGVTL